MQEQQLTPTNADSVDQVETSSSSTNSNSSAPREVKGSDAIQEAERSEVTKEVKSTKVLSVPKETVSSNSSTKCNNCDLNEFYSDY